METAPARQPRIGPARPRTRRTMRLALAAIGAALAASAVLLQPFADSHLFPGNAGPRHSASPPLSAPTAVPDLLVAPAAVAPSPEERAAAPARGAPAAPSTVERPLATSGSLPSAATMAERPVLPVAPVAAPPPQPIPPPAAAAAQNSAAGAAAPVLPPTVSVSAPVPAAAAAVVGTPPPREPLPLQTDLLPPHG